MDDKVDWRVESLAWDFIDNKDQPVRRTSVRTAHAFAGRDPVDLATPHGAVASWRVGEGPAALLVHGARDDHSIWSPLIDDLIDAGKAIVAVDMPDHGQSAAQTGFDVGRWADVILAVADQAGPVDAIAAHSFGTTASMVAIGRGLPVDRAVLLAPPLSGHPEFTPDPLLVRIEREDPPVAARIRAILADRAEKAGEVPVDAEALARTLGHVDALILHSRDDDVCLAGASERLSAAWPGSRLFLIDDGGHRDVARDEDVLEQAVAHLARA